MLDSARRMMCAYLGVAAERATEGRDVLSAVRMAEVLSMTVVYEGQKGGDRSQLAVGSWRFYNIQVLDLLSLGQNTGLEKITVSF